MKRLQRFRGPSLVLLVAVHILLFAANMVAAALLRQGAPFVNPYAAGEIVRTFFLQNPRAVQVSNFFLFGSAVPLGIFAATVVSRLRYLGVRAAGTNIALLGGFWASGALALSGAFGWVLSLPEVTTSVSVVQALCFTSFLFGGMGFTVGFGLLVAGISITGYFAGLLSRGLVVFGMVVAIAGELSSLSLLFYPANFLIPIARYLGIVWLVLVAIRLSKTVPKEQLVAGKAA
jgi:hypothetical protein